MTFLAIALRELRILSRRKELFRVRWWAVVLAMVVGFFSLAIVATSRSSRNLGNPLFNILTGYAFGISLLSGVGLTADALSLEKREGTLGLLFLTEMNGYDIVLGKLISRGVHAFYALLALLPITAMPLLLGGVTGAEFWRRALALVITMFISLVTGLLASTFHLQSQRAMASTAALLLLLVAGVPGLVYIINRAWLTSSAAIIRCLSPFFAYSYAADTLYGRHAQSYWASLVGSALVGLLFLVLASLALPRLWQEGNVQLWPKGPGKSWQRSRRQKARTSTTRNRELLAKNPVAWLLRAESRPWAAWTIVIAWGATVTALLMSHSSSAPSLVMGHYGMTTSFGFLLKIIFAFQACKFFSEGRRNSGLELLLCTPLMDREIIQGQLSALWRSFCGPLTLFCAFLFLPTGVCFVTGLATRNFQPVFSALGGSLLGGFFVLRLLLDLLAVSWFGMGMALSSKKPQLAAFLTILYVLVLPAILSFCFLDIVADIFFIFWGITRARRDLRQMLSQQYAVLSVS
jgi:hypothetical protein